MAHGSPRRAARLQCPRPRIVQAGGAVASHDFIGKRNPVRAVATRVLRIRGIGFRPDQQPRLPTRKRDGLAECDGYGDRLASFIHLVLRRRGDAVDVRRGQADQLDAVVVVRRHDRVGATAHLERVDAGGALQLVKAVLVVGR